MRRILTVILLLLILVIAILMGAQNNQYVVINYLIAQSELRLSMLMALMVMLGIVISAGLFSLVWLRLRWRIRQLERKQQASTSSPKA